LQFTAPRFLANRFLTPLPEKVQFELTHGAFEPQQQTVIQQTRVIDAIGIYDERSHQTAQLDEVMPVTTVAGQSGCFDAEDRAHAPGAHFGNQPCKTWTIDLAGTGTSQVLVDDLDLLKPELASLVSQGILSPLTLQIIS
jgi:hypothetical protein